MRVGIRFAPAGPGVRPGLRPILLPAAAGGIASALAADPAPAALLRLARRGHATRGRPPLGPALSRPGRANCGLPPPMPQRRRAPERGLAARRVTWERGRPSPPV